MCTEQREAFEEKKKKKYCIHFILSMHLCTKAEIPETEV